VPQQRALEHLFPGPDARQRRIHDDEAGDPLRVLRREGVADHVAEVVGDEVGLVDPQRVQDAGDVVSLRLLVVAVGGTRRARHPAQVGSDNGVATGEVRRQRSPHVARLAIAVQEDHRGALAADPDMDDRALRLDLPGAEVRGKRLNLRRGGQRQRQGRDSAEHEPNHLWPP
jgi:hypothetical protein